MNIKYATKEYICHYYQEIYNALKGGRTKENLEEAFDEAGMILSGVLVKCMEKEERRLEKRRMLSGFWIICRNAAWKLFINLRKSVKISLPVFTDFRGFDKPPNGNF